MKILFLLMLLSACGEYRFYITQDPSDKCLDVRNIDGMACSLKEKKYTCVGKGDFILDISTIGNK